MPVQLIGSTQNAVLGDSVTVDIPNVPAGTLLVAAHNGAFDWMATDTARDPDPAHRTAPPGWTYLQGVRGAGGLLKLAYRVTQAGDPAQVTFTGNPKPRTTDVNGQNAAILAFSGAKIPAPADFTRADSLVGRSNHITPAPAATALSSLLMRGSCAYVGKGAPAGVYVWQSPATRTTEQVINYNNGRPFALGAATDDATQKSERTAQRDPAESRGESWTFTLLIRQPTYDVKSRAATRSTGRARYRATASLTNKAAVTSTPPLTRRRGPATTITAQATTTTTTGLRARSPNTTLTSTSRVRATTTTRAHAAPARITTAAAIQTTGTRRAGQRRGTIATTAKITATSRIESGRPVPPVTLRIRAATSQHRTRPGPISPLGGGVT